MSFSTWTAPTDSFLYLMLLMTASFSLRQTQDSILWSAFTLCEPTFIQTNLIKSIQ